MSLIQNELLLSLMQMSDKGINVLLKAPCPVKEMMCFKRCGKRYGKKRCASWESDSDCGSGCGKRGAKPLSKPLRDTQMLDHTNGGDQGDM